jgi:hypothetical protein
VAGFLVGKFDPRGELGSQGWTLSHSDEVMKLSLRALEPGRRSSVRPFILCLRMFTGYGVDDGVNIPPYVGVKVHPYGKAHVVKNSPLELWIVRSIPVNV